ncbi:hypothetical protein [Aeromicrobium panaciterrae]|uniref:hypothetical protein n=1 Tax=Aeromicrobium panaciterrae TaxID=363861 RepID=UPI0031E2DC56
MSLVPTINRKTMIAGVAGLVLVGGGIAYAARSGDDSPNGPSVHLPTKSVEVVASTTPAEAAVAVSKRLYASSPVVVVADSTDVSSQELAMTAAEQLRVPVLLDGPTTAAEVKRLDASTVLTVGTTGDYDHARTLTTKSLAAETSRVRKTYEVADVERFRAFVLTASAKTDAVAAATATNAGATVLEVPGGDPRTVPAAAEAMAEQPKAPVVALGAPFGDGLAYTVGAVRSGVEQPGGGYLAFPGRTMVALYGHPSTSALGVLGEQGVTASVKRAELLATKYRKVVKTPVVPTFEIIATVASAGAGKDKNYSAETPIKDLLPLVDAAEKAGVYVILDLQPGRTDFLVQAKAYESLLKRPHVGLALDPEWRLRPKQKHLTQIGKVSVNEINRVGDWLAALTRDNRLPQKVFVLHQFNIRMIKGRARLNTNHPELATVIHVDGQGAYGAKQGTWKYLRQDAPKGVFWGWKNFVDEDPHMLSTSETWAKVKPHPDLISYQ